MMGLPATRRNRDEWTRNGAAGLAGPVAPFMLPRTAQAALTGIVFTSGAGSSGSSTFGAAPGSTTSRTPSA